VKYHVIVYLAARILYSIQLMVY